MKIAYISPSFPPDLDWDKGANRAYELALGMRDAGHQVNVFAIANEVSAVTRQDGLTVHRQLVDQSFTTLKMVAKTTPHLLTMMSSRNALWKSFLQEHARQPFDLVDAPSTVWDALVPGLPGLLPLVVRHQEHLSTYDRKCFTGGGAFDLNRQLIDSLSDVAFRFSDSVYVADQSLAQQLQERLSVTAAVIEEAIDLSRFTASGAVAFAKDVDDRVVIVARLQDEKVSSLIRDVALAVNEKSTTTQFLLLAEDITSDDDEFHAQDSFKNLLKEPAQITVSRAYHELLPELLRSAPIVFVAPGSERLPHIWLESMACQRALIASGGDLTSRYLTNDVDSMVVKEFDSDSVCKTILTLKANAELRAKLSQQAASKVTKNHDRSQIVDKLEQIYKLSIENFSSVERASARALAMVELIEASKRLVVSYDKMLYDCLFIESREFRLKHWLDKLSDKNGSSFGQKLLGIFAGRKQ